MAQSLPHTLPWYFGLAFFAVWAASVVASYKILRWIRASRARRRVEVLDRRPRSAKNLPELNP